jgi:DNA-binding FrmR family transcriptional regulator
MAGYTESNDQLKARLRRIEGQVRGDAIVTEASTTIDRLLTR